MADSIYLGAYWTNGNRDADDCAGRLRASLAALARLSPVFARWRPKGRTPAEAIAGEDVLAAQLPALLVQGVNRRDSDGTPIAELGYSWSAWNGNSSAPAAVHVTCGATLAAEGVLNAFVLECPPPTATGAGSLYERPTVIEAVSQIAHAWEPDSAVATSHRLRAVRGWHPGQPVVGWVTYLRADRRVATEIDGADISHSAGGTLITISSDWLDIAAGDIERTAAALERTGALSPMVPRG